MDPAQIRKELVEIFERELLGPAGGEEEELNDSSRSRYLAGMLARAGERMSPEATESYEAEGAPEDPGSSERPPARATLFPSSMGLSCLVDGSVRSLRATFRWASYARRQNGNSGRTVWKRRPERISFGISLDEDGTHTEKGIEITWKWRVHGNGLRHVTVFATNRCAGEGADHGHGGSSSSRFWS